MTRARRVSYFWQTGYLVGAVPLQDHLFSGVPLITNYELRINQNPDQNPYQHLQISRHPIQHQMLSHHP